MKIFLIKISFLIICCSISLSVYAGNKLKSIEITYLASTANPNDYCDGVKFASNAFKKTITKTVHKKIIVADNITQKAIIQKTLIAAAGYPPQGANQVAYLKIRKNTAYIKPIDGWAGVSIFMCHWKPLVEVNLLRFPEIKNIVWTNDLTQWNQL